MAVRTSAGTTLKISASIPATFDAAGYAALAFTSVGEITNMGDFGREFELVTHKVVATRSTVKKKGSFNEGSMSLALGLDTDDAGQILVKSASLSDNDFSFLVTTQNLDKYFFQAQVMGFKLNISDVDSITAATVTLELTSSPAGVGVVEVLS